MKALMIFKGVLLGLAISIASSALAAEKGSLHLMSPANVAGKQLDAGDYTVRWEGTGSTVDVKIMQGNKALAVVPATVVPLDSAPSSNLAIVETGGDGSRSLLQMRFSGKKFALETKRDSGEVNANNRN
jgi:hypothetical protein